MSEDTNNDFIDNNGHFVFQSEVTSDTGGLEDLDYIFSTDLTRVALEMLISDEITDHTFTELGKFMDQWLKEVIKIQIKIWSHNRAIDKTDRRFVCKTGCANEHFHPSENTGDE